MKYSRYNGLRLAACGLRLAACGCSCQINSLFHNNYHSNTHHNSSTCNTNIHINTKHPSNSTIKQNQEAICSAEGFCMDSGGAFLRIHTGSDSNGYHQASSKVSYQAVQRVLREDSRDSCESRAANFGAEQYSQQNRLRT